MIICYISIYYDDIIFDLIIVHYRVLPGRLASLRSAPAGGRTG